MRRVKSCKRRLFVRHLRRRKLKLFLKKLRANRILPSYLREFECLERISQDPHYHPEGSVWNHTLKCVGIAEEERYPFTIVLASLFHDVGKCVVFDGNNFWGHEKEGAKRVVKFFFKYPLLRNVVKKVKKLVLDHMKLHQPLSEKKLLKLVREYPYLEDLLLLTEVDLKGSIGYSEVFLENKRKMELLKDRWEKEKAKPFPLLNGYEIMAYLCIPPGKRVGVLKESLYEAQLKGIIRTKNEAIAYLKAIAKV